jgi:hypothetical protein
MVARRLRARSRRLVKESPVFRDAGPTGIVVGLSNTVWFLGYGSNQVYEISFAP